MLQGNQVLDLQTTTMNLQVFEFSSRRNRELFFMEAEFMSLFQKVCKQLFGVHKRFAK